MQCLCKLGSVHFEVDLACCERWPDRASPTPVFAARMGGSSCSRLESSFGSVRIWFRGHSGSFRRCCVVCTVAEIRPTVASWSITVPRHSNSSSKRNRSRRREEYFLMKWQGLPVTRRLFTGPALLWSLDRGRWPRSLRRRKIVYYM